MGHARPRGPKKYTVRRTFQFTKTQLEDVDRLAKELGIYPAEIIRKGVELALAYYEEFGEILKDPRSIENCWSPLEGKIHIDEQTKAIVTERGSYVTYVSESDTAKRLVASWNKCLGLSIKELEDG